MGSALTAVGVFLGKDRVNLHTSFFSSVPDRKERP